MQRTEILEAVSAAILRRCDEKKLAHPNLNESMPIDSRLGLDSLDWAVVVVELENTLNVDPFADGTEASLGSLGDLVTLYDTYLSKAQDPII